MKQMVMYYLMREDRCVAGPFQTLDKAIEGKQRFIAPVRQFLTVVKHKIQVEEVL